MFDSLIGGLFSMMAADKQADTARDIANAQLNAVKEQRDRLYSELDPTSVNAQATDADIRRSKNRLALQSQLDPALFASRYTASNNILDSISNPYGAGDAMADQLAAELSTANPTTEAIKQKLLDSALDELDAGASLPPDLQAELVQAGLERAGTVGAGTSSRGLAGQETRKLIGKEGLALQKDRRNQAVTMTDAADSLANRRYSLLASVFPSLKSLQTQNLNNNMAALGMSNSLMPDVGLSGTNLTNLLMARVGASNALTAQTGDIYAGLGGALGAATAGLYGGMAGAASGLTDAASGLWKKLSTSGEAGDLRASDFSNV